ncbi:MAG: UDP-N-acetylmuramoyl-tripeptide--D-alanyl-D-alanine ligase [Candidatus Eremiobacteraeota bacterium]|nr:UDP-N-acetylmuramoyl-tripeptide--D-alanyl-D-alanine ligase [Candidatus Eremiobacteraeota bacterium]
MKLPISAAMSALGATLYDADAAPLELRISTDTRTLQPGDAFLALRGARFNGHDYAGEAVARGASLLVIDEPQARVAGTAAMLVARTNIAYMTLAGLARERFSGRVIAVTGSAGKTTTKAFLQQLLTARFGSRVAGSPGNENNEIGVSKLLLAASDEQHDAVVVEMGARHPGDIETLVSFVKPEVGILTNIGDAHLEIMGSREQLAETKWALFSHGARAVLNADDHTSVARAAGLPEPPHWFAARDDDAPVTLDRATVVSGTRRLVDQRPGDRRELPIEVRIPGLHNRANLAAALAGALELGVPLEAAAEKIAALRLPEGRFESIVMPQGWRIIFDAYNASAAGTIAALDALSGEPRERTIAVLGSMAELGEEAAALHERVGERAAACADVLIVTGDHGAALARGARRAGVRAPLLLAVSSNAEAADWLLANVRPGDVVFIKGSRKYRLEEIVERLRTVLHA